MKQNWRCQEQNWLIIDSFVATELGFSRVETQFWLPQSSCQFMRQGGERTYFLRGQWSGSGSRTSVCRPTLCDAYICVRACVWWSHISTAREQPLYGITAAYMIFTDWKREKIAKGKVSASAATTLRVLNHAKSFLKGHWMRVKYTPT